MDSITCILQSFKHVKVAAGSASQFEIPANTYRECRLRHLDLPKVTVHHPVAERARAWEGHIRDSSTICERRAETSSVQVLVGSRRLDNRIMVQLLRKVKGSSLKLQTLRIEINQAQLALDSRQPRAFILQTELFTVLTGTSAHEL